MRPVPSTRRAGTYTRAGVLGADPVAPARPPFDPPLAAALAPSPSLESRPPPPTRRMLMSMFVPLATLLGPEAAPEVSNFRFVAEATHLAGVPIATARPPLEWPLGDFVYDVDADVVYQRWIDAANEPVWRVISGAGGGSGTVTQVAAGDGIDVTPTTPSAAVYTVATKFLAGDGIQITTAPDGTQTFTVVPLFTASLAAATPLVQVGGTLVTPAFTAAYTSGPPDSAFLTNTDNAENKNVTATPTSFTSSMNYTKATYGATVTWTLTATKGATVKTPTATSTWTQKVYLGQGAPGQSSAAFILSLPGTLRLTQKGSYTQTATTGNKIYFAYRKAYGTSTFFIGGFEGGMLPPTTVSVTNTDGFTEDYYLYESTLTGLGTNVSVVVS